METKNYDENPSQEAVELAQSLLGDSHTVEKGKYVVARLDASALSEYYIAFYDKNKDCNTYIYFSGNGEVSAANRPYDSRVLSILPPAEEYSINDVLQLLRECSQ